MAPCAQPCQRATVNRSAAPCERARFARVARAAWHQGGGTGRVDALRGGPLSQAVGGRAPSLAATAPQRKLLAPKPPLDFLGVSNQLSAVLARARLQSRTAVLRGGLTGEQARAALRGCGARNAPPASSWLLRPPHRPRKAGAARRSRAAGAWRPPPAAARGCSVRLPGTGNIPRRARSEALFPLTGSLCIGFAPFSSSTRVVSRSPRLHAR